MNHPRAANHHRTGALLLGLAAAVLAPAAAMAKSSDRNQPMTLDSATSDCTQAAANSRCVFTGAVEITQGTLVIRAERAEVVQRNGEIEQVVLTGKQATLKQDMDDGSTMNARADRIVYEPAKEVLTLTGNYQVESPRGSNSGQRMVYNMASGQVQSGGDGSRVRTVIQPRAQSQQAPARDGGN